MPPLRRVGLAAEAVGYIFDIGAGVTADHPKPCRPPAVGNAATGDLIFCCRPGRLDSREKEVNST